MIDKIKLIGATVLVKEETLTNELSSGIVVPGRENEQTNKGVVLKVGTGAILESGLHVPMSVSVGDTVVYATFSGRPVKISPEDKDKYIVLNERDIVCIIED